MYSSALSCDSRDSSSLVIRLALKALRRLSGPVYDAGHMMAEQTNPTPTQMTLVVRASCL